VHVGESPNKLHAFFFLICMLLSCGTGRYDQGCLDCLVDAARQLTTEVPWICTGGTISFPLYSGTLNLRVVASVDVQ
jgi:hypothetical protein